MCTLWRRVVRQTFTKVSENMLPPSSGWSEEFTPFGACLTIVFSNTVVACSTSLCNVCKLLPEDSTRAWNFRLRNPLWEANSCSYSYEIPRLVPSPSNFWNPEPISAAYLKNSSHKSVCLHLYFPNAARQRLDKNAIAAKNLTQQKNYWTCLFLCGSCHIKGTASVV
jgi:hypothetical protein